MTKAVVVYATITGNNEDVADLVVDGLENLGVEVEEKEITMATIDDFQAADICVVCPYTYDEGALPEEGLDFYEELKDATLAGKVYGVAGSGDTFYGDDFCRAVDDFAQAFESAGATQGAASVKIDLAPEGDDVQKLDDLAAALVAKAGK